MTHTLRTTSPRAKKTTGPARISIESNMRGSIPGRFGHLPDARTHARRTWSRRVPPVPVDFGRAVRLAATEIQVFVEGMYASTLAKGFRGSSLAFTVRG